MRLRETTYLLTSVTDARRRIFQKHGCAKILCETLLHYRVQGFYRLHAFVVMPDHFHALLTPGAHTTLEKCAQFIKGGSSHNLHQGKVWQKGFNQQGVANRAEYENFTRYVEANPERRGLADWSFVSSRFGASMDPMPDYLRDEMRF